MKKEIIVTSFGTSYKDTRERTIGAIEGAVRKRFGDEYKVSRAFTSGFIIRKIRETEGEETADVKGALERALAEGVEEIVVQPTHFMKGVEYDKIINITKEYKDRFERLVVGEPLLYRNGDYDFKTLVNALIEGMKEKLSVCMGSEEALVYMGHGTEAEANEVYEKLNSAFCDAGADNIIVGTVEAKPDINDCVSRVKALGVKKVLLAPLMVVAGDHANNDLAGDEEDSWKSIFTAAGFNTDVYLAGIGELASVHDIYLSHILDVI